MTAELCVLCFWRREAISTEWSSSYLGRYVEFSSRLCFRLILIHHS
jgi:hypothetical protein